MSQEFELPDIPPFKTLGAVYSNIDKVGSPYAVQNHVYCVDLHHPILNDYCFLLSDVLLHAVNGKFTTVGLQFTSQTPGQEEFKSGCLDVFEKISDIANIKGLSKTTAKANALDVVNGFHSCNIIDETIVCDSKSGEQKLGLKAYKDFMDRSKTKFASVVIKANRITINTADDGCVIRPKFTLIAVRLEGDQDSRYKNVCEALWKDGKNFNFQNLVNTSSKTDLTALGLNVEINIQERIKSTESDQKVNKLLGQMRQARDKKRNKGKISETIESEDEETMRQFKKLKKAQEVDKKRKAIRIESSSEESDSDKESKKKKKKKKSKKSSSESESSDSEVEKKKKKKKDKKRRKKESSSDEESDDDTSKKASANSDIDNTFGLATASTA